MVFGGLFDKAKNFLGSVYEGGKKVFGNVYEGVKKGKEFKIQFKIIQPNIYSWS